MTNCTRESARTHHPRAAWGTALAAILITMAAGCGDALRGGESSSVFAILHVQRTTFERAVDQGTPVVLVATLGGVVSRNAYVCRDDQGILRGNLPGHSVSEEVVDDEIVTTSALDIEGCQQDVPYVAELWTTDVPDECPFVDEDWENGIIDDIPLGSLLARFEYTIPHELTDCHEPIPDTTERALGTASLPFVRLKFPQDAFLEQEGVGGP